MSKVLIDRALLERVQERLDPHRDAVLWGAVCDTFHTAPSGTPAMPIKAYYHEAPNEYGGFNKSVGLEVRKQFNDAPLVLESDAMARIACLEGEIAKRDARIVELDKKYGWALSELAAIKAQEPVAHDTKGSRKALGAMNAKLKAKIGRLERELAAPAAKPQVVIPELDREGFEDEYSGEYGTPVSVLRLLRDGENYIEKPQHSDRLNSSWWMWKVALSRLNAAPAAPAADAGIVDMYRHLQTVTPYRFKKIQDASITDGGDVMYFHKDRFDAALLADMAAHCAAKGVV